LPVGPDLESGGCSFRRFLHFVEASGFLRRAGARIRYTAISVHRCISVLAPCLLTAACVSQPEIYAPPAQRKPLDQEVLVRSSPMLEMGDPSAERAFVADIARGPQASSWRWTNQRPTVKMTLKSNLNLRYHMEFTLAEVTFKETGPVEITFLVNDQVLDRVKYDKPGDKIFDKPVPEAMLKPMNENTLAAEIDKVWISKGDGQKLGFILSRIGLLR
jgi:hypothetical protein